MSEMIEVILTGGASDTLEAFLADLKQAIMAYVEDDETRNRALGLFAFLERHHRRGHVYHTARH